MFLLFGLQHVLAQVTCGQAILEEYTNGDGIHLKCSAVYSLRTETGLSPTLCCICTGF
jgi:hypothetical protein